MKFQQRCVECSKNQGLRVYQLALKSNGKPPSQDEIDRLRAELAHRIENADPNLTPAELSQIAIRTGEKFAQCGDPFKSIKKHNNELALSLYPELKQRVKSSDDPLYVACQLAACGNIIDLGIHDHFDIHATIEKVLSEGFQRDDYQEFIDQLNELTRLKEQPCLLYFCDNAGEIVFDRIFIEELKHHYETMWIAAVVRKKPILNDATIEDAAMIGLDKIAPIYDNGDAELGSVVAKFDPPLRKLYYQADVIVSKGQANYETLCRQPENIFFILKAKCEIIAESLGVKLWDAVMSRSPFVTKNV